MIESQSGGGAPPLEIVCTAMFRRWKSSSEISFLSFGFGVGVAVGVGSAFTYLHQY
jgi:hypothetical protein